MQPSQSKNKVGDGATPRKGESLKVCSAGVFFLSSGTWPLNLPMFAGYDIEIYEAEMGINLTLVATCHPHGNGCVKNLVVGICEMVHTSVVGKDLKDDHQ